MAEGERQNTADNFDPEGGATTPDTLDIRYLLHVLGNPLNIIAAYEVWQSKRDLDTLQQAKNRCLLVIRHLQERFSQDFHLFPELPRLLQELRKLVEQEQWEQAVQAYKVFIRSL